MKQYLALCLTVSITACGGGGGGNKSATPPAPTVTITSVSPLTAVVGTLASFDVVGSNLPDGMRFSLPGCNGVTESAGGTASKRKFSCTPVGALASYKGQVSTAAGSAPFDFSVDYLSPILSASVGWNRTMVVTADGSLWAWGIRIGDGTSDVVLVPKKIGNGFISAISGESTALAIKKDGTLWSWGGWTLAGIANPGEVLAPMQIGAGYAKVVIEWTGTTSGEHAIGLKTDGTLWTWGSRAAPGAQSGFQSTPRMFASGFSDLGVGDMALKADGSVWSWTIGDSGSATDSAFIPRKLGSASFTHVASGFNVAYGLKADGTLWNWGSYAIRPAGAASDWETPYPVTSGIRAIASGVRGAMMIKTDNTLAALGSEQAQSGEYLAAWPGQNCSMALKTDGSLVAWGACYFGDGQSLRWSEPDNATVLVVIPK